MRPKTRNADSQTTLKTRPAQEATSPAQREPAGPPCTEGACVSAASTVPASSMASADFKAELLVALREEMVGIFKSELQMAMTENLSQIKSELQSVKTELAANLAATKSDVGELRGTVSEMEESLSNCTDDIVYLKGKVETLSTKVLALENKCEDLEGRSRRNNIRIIGLSEQSDTVTAASTSDLLKEMFNLEKAPLIDRAHRSSTPKPKPGERPRPIIARLHYYADCVGILQRARAQQRIKIGDSTISVFPDHTARTAEARAAFNHIRRQLRDIPGIRYGLMYPALLRITTSGGVTKDFTSPGEAAVFVKTLK
ncbi:unnamed protein product [Knipowitschia caucasica]